MNHSRGYTLIELIVAVGLFAIVMTIASGAYLIMINANRQAQGITTGINNLSYALESMTRNIRTGTTYSCGGSDGTSDGPSSSKFAFNDINNPSNRILYNLSGGTIWQTTNAASGGTPVALTDPSVNIPANGLMFYCSGTAPYNNGAGDSLQAHVTIVVSGTVNVGPGKPPAQFNIETGATMRGTDL